MGNLSVETRAHLLSFWLIISAFGIMFAVLSWLQESSIIPPADEIGAWKGVLAVLSGILLYWFVARNMTGGPADE
jgi:hypothetical protein